MSDTLKDQLLKLGFKSAPKPERTAPTKRAVPSGKKPARDHAARHAAPGDKPRRGGEMDLAKAYAIRAQKEKDERIAAERERQEEARQRREARARLTEFLAKVRRNDDAAEIARHFPYGGKIRRIHVTADQLKALNAGELAVVQLGGRYHLVSVADGRQAEAILAGSLALLVDPDVPVQDEDYSDPKYQVPDDLIW